MQHDFSTPEFRKTAFWAPKWCRLEKVTKRLEKYGHFLVSILNFWGATGDDDSNIRVNSEMFRMTPHVNAVLIIKLFLVIVSKSFVGLASCYTTQSHSTMLMGIEKIAKNNTFCLVKWTSFGKLQPSLPSYHEKICKNPIRKGLDPFIPSCDKPSYLCVDNSNGPDYIVLIIYPLKFDSSPLKSGGGWKTILSY